MCRKQTYDKYSAGWIQKIRAVFGSLEAATYLLAHAAYASKKMRKGDKMPSKSWYTKIDKRFFR